MYKAIPTLLLILLSIQEAFLYESCPVKSKQCAKDKLKLSNLCYLQGREGVGGQDSYYFNGCSEGEQCVLEPTNIGQCVKKLTQKKVGESCTLMVECESYLCATNNTCSSIPDGNICNEDANCGYNSFCFYPGKSEIERGVCTPLKKEGEECAFDNYCIFNYACGIIDETGKKKCAKMFSRKAGELSDNNLLCESGLASPNPDNNNTYQCADYKMSSETCTPGDVDGCINTISFGNKGSKNQTETCKCKWNGQGHCNLDSSSEQWQNFIKVYNEEVTKINPEKMHVAVTRQHWWDNTNIIKARIDYAEYFEIDGTEDCVKQYYYLMPIW